MVVYLPILHTNASALPGKARKHKIASFHSNIALLLFQWAKEKKETKRGKRGTGTGGWERAGKERIVI